MKTLFVESGDLNLAELGIRRTIADAYTDILKYLEGSEGDVVAAFSSRLEFEEIKAALRVWYGRVIRGVNVESQVPYVRGPFAESIMASQSADAVLSALGGTEYAEALAKPLSGIADNSTLFRADLALDAAYFTRLASAVERLRDPDNTVAERLIGLHVDNENLNRIERIRTFYHLPDEVADEALISILFGRRDTRNTGVNELIHRSVESGNAGVIDKMEIVHVALEFETERAIRKLLAGPPFTIGIVLSYGMLKEREVGRIVRSLNALRYQGVAG